MDTEKAEPYWLVCEPDFVDGCDVKHRQFKNLAIVPGMQTCMRKEEGTI